MRLTQEQLRKALFIVRTAQNREEYVGARDIILKGFAALEERILELKRENEKLSSR